MRIVAKRKNKSGLRSLIFAGIMTGMGALAYRALLNEEARDSIKELKETFRESKDIIRDKVEEIRGQIMDEDELSDNRKRTQEQWESLGY